MKKEKPRCGMEFTNVKGSGMDVNEKIVEHLRVLSKFCAENDIRSLNVHVTKDGYGSAFALDENIDVSIFADGTVNIADKYYFPSKEVAE